MKYKVYLESIDPKCNRARWYRLTATITLFGGAVTREWGRIGQKGRCHTLQVGSFTEAKRLVQRILRVRERHGYVVVG
ncbi:MAG: WGR domain-containing protein [Desulfobulbaceae bacterium]|nr:WGR domain-containing protein [Desulfobulbaceae bacterium]